MFIWQIIAFMIYYWCLVVSTYFYQNKETKDYALSFNTEDDVKRSSNGDQRAAAYARLQNAASENIFGSAISNKGNYRPGKKGRHRRDGVHRQRHPAGNRQKQSLRASRLPITGFSFPCRKEPVPFMDISIKAYRYATMIPVQRRNVPV